MGSGREVAGIAEILKDVLAGPATGYLAGRIEHELAARDLGTDTGGEAGRHEPERCRRCGGLKDGRDHESNADRVCRCG